MRKPVQCGNCRHYQVDTIGDGTGIGTCTVDGEGKQHQVMLRNYHKDRFEYNWVIQPLWPRALRVCGEFRERVKE